MRFPNRTVWILSAGLLLAVFGNRGNGDVTFGWTEPLLEWLADSSRAIVVVKTAEVNQAKMEYRVVEILERAKDFPRLRAANRNPTHGVFARSPPIMATRTPIILRCQREEGDP